MEIKTIAVFRGAFDTKFGIPRQSGMAPLPGRIVFEPEYRDENALRGLSGYSHLWLIWQFSQVEGGFRPTVRPPRLGGNRRMGVFATRSPYRPNPIGLSSVRLEGIEHTAEQGAVLQVSGADLMDGTPILDIKPYLAFTDAHPDAVCGFADRVYGHTLEVDLSPELARRIPPEHRQTLVQVLSLDPRPAYQEEPDRIYGMQFAGHEISFRVQNGLLTVENIS